jgi:pimeloyl-ACP methyl ester carboxylesterase
MALLLACPTAGAADSTLPPTWQDRHDQLVHRLRHLAKMEGAFGPAYQPLYQAALPWYELWGGREQHAVDPDMVPPETYADELASALEQGRNFFAEHPGDLFPLVFRTTLPSGKAVDTNYWLTLPAGFPGDGRTFPLLVGLHGSGWLAHKISYKKLSNVQGPMFTVTPIDEGGPWQIDFLNAYLDRLESMLPIDQDRVYLEGHSLGAMATWEWALNNPERFAAISPRAGIGEPYRASRLKNVPAWVIHGELDDVVPRGFAEEMISALQDCGAAVRYSIIKGGPHNMPPDLDQEQVMAWYLRQTRSPLRTPPDPRDGLGLNAAGFSPWEIITVPETPSWKSEPIDFHGREVPRSAARPLFDKVHERGELVDAPLRGELDLATHLTTLWLAVPRTLHAGQPADPSIVTLPQSRFVRFYFRGTLKAGLDHVEAIRPEVEAAGNPMNGKVWITALTIWHNTPNSIAEYWIGTN